MKYSRIIFCIIIILFFSGCIEEITARFQKVEVVYVNVSVAVEGNTTLITNIDTRGAEMTKLYAPGMVIPEKFPAIYAEVLQEYNASKPGPLTVISAPNGLEYTGPKNYSFIVQIFGDKKVNRSQPLFLYNEILGTDGKRIAKAMARFNWTG